MLPPALPTREGFIGDGDAISVCVVYLRARGILPYGPAHVTVFDFDQRICNAVARFADRERLGIESAIVRWVLPVPGARRDSMR